MSASTYAYLTRCIPAISVLGVLFLLFVSLIVAPNTKQDGSRLGAAAATSQLVLAVYTLFIHIAPVLFPARLCWAIGDVMKRMKESVAVAEAYKKQTLEKGEAASSLKFVIIIPAYKESVETMEETLKVLGSHWQARSAYHIYLAMEAKEEHSDKKAANLIRAFQSSFYRMSYTIHPFGIPGEAQGKSSNESWAAKQAFKDYANASKGEVIMTTMDSDTHLSARYFSQVAQYHHRFPETSAETIYVPPIVFDRNIHEVPLPVRTSDMIWAGAGISNLYDGSNICIPTSVYSLPMVLAENVGGWDTGPDAIGEDMHMYLKCFFALSGNLNVKVVYAAASQCDVSSDGTGFSGYVDGLKARYKQALRHMWGSLDTGYAIRQTISMFERRRRMSFGASPDLLDTVLHTKHLLFNAISAVCSPNGAALPTPIIKCTPPSPQATGHPQPFVHAYNKPIHFRNLCTLLNSLFEAHFVPVHLALILATTTIYDLLAGASVPHHLALALRISGLCRFAGWSLICVYFYRYAQYHHLCLSLREQEMREAGLLDECDEGKQHEQRSDGYSRRLFGPLGGVAEAGLFFIGGFLFGSIPACQAVLSHVFTERLVYQVSLKPSFMKVLENVDQKTGSSLSSSSSATPKSPSQAPTHPKKRPTTPARTAKTAGVPLHKKASSHVRCPSDTWRKQAVATFEHFTASMALNRPVKRDD